MALPEVAQGARRAILNSYSLYPLNLPGVNALCAKYTKKYAYASTASKSLENPEAALYPKYEKRWQARQEPLWWNASTWKDFANKKVVRSWVARRVRQAFVESLKKRGYTQDGSRINGLGKPLVGTAQFFPQRPILKTKFNDLVLQTDSVLQAIITHEGRSYRGAKTAPKEKKPFGKYTKRKGFKPPEVDRPLYRSIK